MSDTQFYGRFDNSTPNNQKKSYYGSDSVGYSISRVFGYMFLWLAISTAICFGIAFLFNYLLTHATTVAEKDTILGWEIALSIVSGLGVIILTIVTQFVLLRGRHSIAVPAIIYAVFMGALLGVISSLLIEVYANAWFIIGVSFGITTGIFGIMALIGLLAKSKLNALPIIAMGLFLGTMMISIVLLIMMLVPGLRQYYIWWYWILSFAIFAAVMFTTIWDIRNIKTLAQRGELTKNLSMYLAFNLYVDFIYILLRVLYFVMIIAGKSKN